MYCVMHTTEFRVKDPATFEAMMDDVSGIELKVTTDADGPLYSMAVEHGEWGEIEDPSDPDGMRQFDVVRDIAPHLPDGEIVVALEAETDTWFADAGATAFDNSGKTTTVNMSDIYGKALMQFGRVPRH